MLNVVFAAHSGLWGVLVIDMIQFFIKMTAVFAAAWFSLVEVGRRLGGEASGWVGLKQLVATLSTLQVVQCAGGRCAAGDVGSRTARASRSSTCCRTSACPSWR